MCYMNNASVKPITVLRVLASRRRPSIECSVVACESGSFLRDQKSLQCETEGAGPAAPA